MTPAPMAWALLSGLTADQREAALAVARRRTFARGEVVFHEGDPGDTIHFVEHGHLSVRVSTPNGDTATLRIVGPGEHFGELALIALAPRSATITALEPTQTLTLHRDQLQRLRDDNPEIDRAILETMVHEVRRLSGALLEAMYVPIAERLPRRLLELARSYPPDASGRSVIPLTQDDLAGLCGTTRPTVNQLLGRLADKGVVEIARGRIIITDSAGLTTRARLPDS
ncbi:Crp/Fnr family transcriptional regulator [Acidothermaceae bacterium B102]|nr:Crp/Fnr family transcriptional regulator [Acidothermaceae bacterium B102]